MSLRKKWAELLGFKKGQEMNNNPYEILGVRPGATEDEIKAAYKDLAKKYHPDQFADDNMKALANEKMAEINAAYDEIIMGLSGKIDDVRTLIKQNRLDEAEGILSGISEAQRDAEWYFLKGSVSYRKGWLDEAYSYFNTASSMDPQNQEYKSALNQLSFQRGGGMNSGPYGGYRPAGNAVGCNACDICNTLICADCCCECMGGDLIGCC
jgi:tetratricopeptide (TPR) repeat protein